MIYIQLTQGQRYQIKALLDIGCKRTKIAHQLGVDKSTISCELRRNRGRRGYRPKQTQEKALERRNKKVQPNISAKTWQIVAAKLLQDWSPEQITGLSILFLRFFSEVFSW